MFLTVKPLSSFWVRINYVIPVSIATLMKAIYTHLRGTCTVFTEDTLPYGKNAIPRTIETSYTAAFGHPVFPFSGAVASLYVPRSPGVCRRICISCKLQLLCHRMLFVCGVD